jgi:hypothetical protein
MKNNNSFYNASNFKYFRRYIKPITINKAFIDLIESKEDDLKSQTITSETNKDNITDKNNNHTVTKEDHITKAIIPNNIENAKKKENGFIIDLLYQKDSIEKIKKIRDLFIEFDTNKTHTLDQREIYLMFNINKIPITYDEVKELFGFNRRNKYIKFYDFIKLILSKNFAEKFKIFIKSKVKQRLNDGETCPNDLGEMITHLSEFEQLSPEIKNKKREGFEKYIKPTPSSVPKFLLKWKLERNNRYNKNKINYSLKKSNKDIINGIIEEDNKEGQNKKSGKEITNSTINNKEIDNNLYKKESAFPKEKEIQNFIEISNNKLLKYNKNLTQENIKEKMLERKKKLSKSLNTLNIINNSDLYDNYICYYPTENTFKKIKDDQIVNFSFKENKNHIPNIKNRIMEKNNTYINRRNNEQKNLYFHNQYNQNKFKLYYHLRHFLTANSTNYSSKRRRKHKLTEDEYISLMSNFNVDSEHFPSIKCQNNFNHMRLNTFKNNGGYSYSSNLFLTKI